MNAKLALALILALQVSMSLCEAPQPSDELILKYNALKDRLSQRLRNLAETAKASELGQRAEGLADTPEARQKIDAVLKLASAVGAELEPARQQARNFLLGQYEEKLRPQVGETLQHAIEYIQSYLDVFLPAE